MTATGIGKKCIRWHKCMFRVLIPSVLSILLFVGAYLFFVVPMLEEALMNDKKQMLKELTSTTWQLLEQYNQRVQAGEFSLEEAQFRAKERIRSMRYGEKSKDYFWINDLTPRVLMHPYRTNLEGQVVAEFRDPQGKALFAEFVRVAQERQEGYVDYLWQWKDREDRIAPKLSHIRLYKPWGWIVGTGVYIDEVRQQTAAIKKTHAIIFAYILLGVLAVAGYTVRQGIASEQRTMTANADRQRLTDILEEAHDIIGMANQEEQVLYINKTGARILGWEKTAPRKIADAHPPPVYQLISQEGLPSALRDGSWSGETVILGADGTEIPVSQIIMAHKPEQETNAPIFFSSIMRDLRKQKEAEKERMRLEAQVLHTQKLESLGLLAGEVAHDFNNILLAIMGNANLALQGIPVEHVLHQPLEDIETAALRGAELTRQMLDYSGKGQVSIKPVNLNDMVSEISRMLNVSISKKADLQYELATGLPLIEGDAGQLRQVIMNLITNASDSLGMNRGVITLRTGLVESNSIPPSSLTFQQELSPGTYVLLEVNDTGAGMDEATCQRIFEPFFTTKSTGRGLGLAAVLGIVRGHRGAIQVHSQPGQGTSFRILFPPSSTRLPSPLPSTAAEKTSVKPKPIQGSILLADDEEAVLALGRRILEKNRVPVLTAANGKEVLTLFHQNRGTLAAIVLDLTMPKMDGLETFQALRKLDMNIPILISSGYNEAHVLKIFANTPPSGVIIKPYTAAILMNALSAAIQAA